MTAVVLALAPVFTVIMLGAALRRTGFVPESFWPNAERITYFVFFPSLLFANTAGADLAFGELLPMAVALASAVLLTGGLMFLARPRLALGDAGFTSLFQGAIRPNIYVGLAAGAGLYGQEGVTLIAVGVAAVVPLVNVLSVLVLARYGDAARPSALGIVRTVAGNPLIIAVTLGIAFNLAGLMLPPVIGPTVEILGRAALPIGLMAVGAGLDLAAAGRAGRPVAVSSAGKLLVCPALTAALCLMLGVGGPALVVAVVYNGLPTAASAYVMARQLGGDSRLMAGIITVTTVMAALTLPGILLLVL